jgi:hypothetical protein
MAGKEVEFVGHSNMKMLEWYAKLTGWDYSQDG